MLNQPLLAEILRLLALLLLVKLWLENLGNEYSQQANLRAKKDGEAKFRQTHRIDAADNPPSPDQVFRNYSPVKKLYSYQRLYVFATYFFAVLLLIGLIFRFRISDIALISGFLMLVANRSGNSLYLLRRAEKGDQHERRIANSILAAFEDDVEIFSVLGESSQPIQKPRLYIYPEQDLDIFAHISTMGKSFMFSVMSRGAGKIIYNESTETLGFRGASSKLANLKKPDPLQELVIFENWLLENRPQILRHKAIKALVFADPAVLGTLNDCLYDTISDQKFLRIYREGEPIYVLPEKELINFMLCCQKKITDQQNTPREA